MVNIPPIKMVIWEWFIIVLSKLISIIYSDFPWQTVRLPKAIASSPAALPENHLQP